MKFNPIRFLKVFLLLFLALIITDFIYLSVSISFPNFKVNKNASVKIIFDTDEKNNISTRISASSFSFSYRYGGHTGFNPLFLTARKLFDNPRDYAICIEGIDNNLAFVKQSNHHWDINFGWTYYLDTKKIDSFFNSFPGRKVATKAVVVEDNCAKYFNKNKPFANYEVYYVLPSLKSFHSKTRLSGVSFDKALTEANSRVQLDAGYTQLVNSINRGCLDCVKSLAAKGVNVNGPLMGKTTSQHPVQRSRDELIPPLRKALDTNNFEIFEYLVSQGARDNLSYSAKPDTYRFFKLLVRAGTDINKLDKYGRHALEAAIRYKCLECVKLLVASGVNLNTRYNSHTPVNMALETNNYEMLMFLLEHGAKKNIPGRGMSPYDIINKTDRVKDPRIIELFKRKN